jgi:hypothetical protein
MAFAVKVLFDLTGRAVCCTEIEDANERENPFRSEGTRSVAKNSAFRPVKKVQVEMATRRAKNRSFDYAQDRRAQAYFFQYVERSRPSVTITTARLGVSRRADAWDEELQA